MLPLLRSTIVIILVTFHFKSCSSNHTLSALHYSDLTKLYFSITNGNYQLKLEDQTQLEWSLTNVDGIPILSNDVKDLLLIKTKEFILPILDEIQTRNGGFRLLGFVNVKLVEPKSLTLQIDGSLDALTYEIVKDESMSQSNEAETKISQPQSSSLVKLPSNSFQEIKETITFENKTTTNDISNNYVTTQQQQQLEDSLKQNQSSFESETPLDSKPNMKFNVNSEADDLDNLDELYGPNKKYPEPFLAGKMPSQVVKEKHFNQTQGLPYSYSVRFRSGPLGIIFDNKIPDATIIERVVEGQPAYESGVQAGDRLVAVNEHDTVNVPAKVSMRLLSILPFPKILVFQTKVTLNDPKIAEAKIQSRTYNMTIFYPPHLANHYTIRISEWSKHFDQSQESVCPILYLRTPPSDMFGCEYPLYSEELDLPQTIKTLNSTNLSKNEDNNQMISLLLEEANRQHQSFEILSTGIVKRGICTFVEKTQKLQQVKAKFGIVINTDNELIDMPAGKEITNDIHIPVAMIREHEGDLIHLTSSLQGNDVIAMITSPGKQISSSCSNLLTIAQDITDNWAHSYPYIPSENILNTIAKMPPRKIRTKETEGGRIALGGENGWAYFDYHLALFGPTLLPSGPLPFKLAQPIYGCDPNKYTVRIADHVVGIMRGGGCSFGIKIINAQKLGAKAVVIINNDDSPVIRLMALKDEIALIKIPCVMVARRMLTYVEQMIKPFYRYGQYVITMESTSYLGEYDKFDKT